MIEIPLSFCVGACVSLYATGIPKGRPRLWRCPPFGHASRLGGNAVRGCSDEICRMSFGGGTQTRLVYRLNDCETLEAFDGQG